MKPYKDTDNDSGVAAYEYGDGWILVEFKGGALYEYTSTSAGPENIQIMKRLADSGDGLNAFIQEHVRKAYSRKIR